MSPEPGSEHPLGDSTLVLPTNPKPQTFTSYPCTLILPGSEHPLGQALLQRAKQALDLSQ